jgi:hypothetical protein
VGAGRRRQGLGPFVARDLVAAGAEIVGFVVTRAERRTAVSRAWADDFGIRPAGHLTLAALLAAERLDALAILSPAETHEPHLEAALAAGLHVLCEKPFVWGGTGLAERARRLAAGFDARRLLLWENCQWPYALPAFARLHPGALGARPRRLAMRLQPASRGVQMIGDSVPHVLSLLQALVAAPLGPLERLRFAGGSPDSDRLDLDFVARSGGHEVGVEIELRGSDRHPRQAMLEIDGHRAERVVSADDYRLSFAADRRTVPLPDPLTLLVADFVRTLAAPGDPAAATRSREIGERMDLLEQIVIGFEQHARGEAAP